MKRLLLVVAVSLNALTINDMFEKVKTISDTKIDNLMITKMNTSKQEVVSSLFPKIAIFSSVEHYTNPTSLRPVTPTESAELSRDKKGFPFSQNIFKVGTSFSMPLFVKEIYDNKKRMSILIENSRLKSKLNLLKREALLVTLISKYNYLYSLKEVLLKKENSIKEVIKSLKVGVKNGAVPEFKLIKLETKLNDIKNSILDIQTNINDTNSKIYKLTKTYLENPLKFKIFNLNNNGEFLQVKIIQNDLKNRKIFIKTQKDKKLPNLYLDAKVYKAVAKAYNNDDSIDETFGNIGIYLKWNIFDKRVSSKIEKAKLDYLTTNLQLQKTVKDLKAEATKINQNLKLINKKLSITLNSISQKEELLKSAKIAFLLNRMSVNDYLNYEDDLSLGRAKLYSLIATKNSLIANLAFINGKNLKKVFK